MKTDLYFLEAIFLMHFRNSTKASHLRLMLVVTLFLKLVVNNQHEQSKNY